MDIGTYKSVSSKEWIGVDLDGTLAHYDKFVGHTTIGEPVPLMVERVKQWVADGEHVKIFTARVDASVYPTYLELVEAYVAISQWCRKHIGTALPITNVKDIKMKALYDDRAFSVRKNTGIVINEAYSDLQWRFEGLSK